MRRRRLALDSRARAANQGRRAGRWAAAFVALAVGTCASFLRLPAPEQNAHLPSTLAPQPSRPEARGAAETRPPFELVRPAAAAPTARPRDVAMPGDRPIRVALAQAGQERVLVYLHGMCGAEEGADVWADIATPYGTLVTLRADVPCGDRPGYKWPKEADAIQTRIERALQRVHELEGAPPGDREVWLIGYSQGAHRAERVAAAYPHLYRTLALGGPPTAASPDRLRHVRRVAVFGGELEDTSHMVSGYLALHGAGLEVEYFTLPRAGHGTFGPEGRRVMGEIFAYLAGPTGALD